MTIPHGAQSYEETLNNLCIKYGGTYWNLQESAITSGANAGVVRDMRGLYPGAVSGVTYYNQVTVSGTLSPDVTGTYTAAGMYNGKPYYQRGTDSWYIWMIPGNSRWYISNGLNVFTGGGWRNSIPTFPGDPYVAFLGGATGTATVANVTNSGIYLFVPSGVTLASAGPVICGEQVRAAGLVATGYVSIGASVFDPSGNISFGAWVNMTAVSGATEQVILGCALSATKRLTLSVKSSVLQCGYNNGTTSYACSGTALTGWHHYAFTKASGNNAPVLYIDGAVQSGTTAPTFASTNNTLFGARNDATLGMTGSICYPKMFTNILSASEVNQLYQQAKYCF